MSSMHPKNTGSFNYVNYVKSNSKILQISQTLENLEESLKISRHLEAEQLLKYSILKTENALIKDDLEKANKYNKNVLNLFRQSVTDIRIECNNNLPPSLRREVQRIWHQKY
ncbi:uncharacterized protein [Prorops nasuta]|uniref:uncharacterized protein n=1 Tax=Prorops nasuta TaxID=863751 RepID=UPI0034CE8929